MRLPPARILLACTAAGLVSYGISIVPVILMGSDPPILLMMAGCLPLLLCLYASTAGWPARNPPPFGSYLFFIRLIGVMLLAATGIGSFIVFFWAGRYLFPKLGIFDLELG